MIVPTPIYRTTQLQGSTIPVIIANRISATAYSPHSATLEELNVFENGAVQYGNEDFEDFAHFKQHVYNGKYATSIPGEAEIMIPGIGHFTVAEGAWLYTPATFIEYVTSLVKKFNPAMNNLHLYPGSYTGKRTIYKEAGNGSPHQVDELASRNIFYQENGEYYLTRAVFFRDHTVHFDRLNQPLQISQEEYDSLTKQGIITTTIPVRDTVRRMPVYGRITITGVGSFTVKRVNYFANA